MSEKMRDEKFQKRSDACNEVEACIKEYVDGYEFDDGECSHTPTELESFLIYDAIHGLLDDDEFIAKFTAWKSLCVDAALRTHENGGQESGSVQDAVDKFRALLADCTESERQQARAIFCEVLGVGGQESEAGAGAEHLDVRKILLRVSPGEDGMGHEEYATCVADVEALLTDMGQKLEDYQLSAPPSATAIETAAIMRAAELMVERGVLSRDGTDYQALLALIPQDGRTALEQKCMEVAEHVFYEYSDQEHFKMHTEVNNLRTIVTNLIGAAK